jgi:hypothetical protein
VNAVQALALAHAVATGLMAGLVWFVQVVHYPLFASVGEEKFKAYAAVHQSRTTLIVAPLMLIEAASAIGLVMLWPTEAGPRTLGIASVVLLTVVWVSTFAVQVPMHARLARGFDAGVHRRLVATNWIRTLAWSARAVVATLIVARLG